MIRDRSNNTNFRGRDDVVVWQGYQYQEETIPLIHKMFSTGDAEGLVIIANQENWLSDK